jgi:HPt (histidine-containing phosphotransfer) domain-containing protein
MDDYLSKPFTQEQLETTLRTWLPPHAVLAAPEPQEPAEPDAASGALDANVLEGLRKLGGGSDLVERVIGIYIGDAPNRLRAIREAVIGGDAAAAARAAHALKTASANVGALRLAALCRRLETSGRAGALASDAGLVSEIQAEYAAVATALASWGATTPS